MEEKVKCLLVEKFKYTEVEARETAKDICGFSDEDLREAVRQLVHTGEYLEIREGLNVEAHLEVDVFESEMCSKCMYLPICKGGCLMNNQYEHKKCNIWKFITERLIISDIGLQQENRNNEV